MSHLEAIGNLYVEKQAADAEVKRLSTEYAKLLTLAVKLRDGEYRPEQVTIDIDKQTWALTLTAADLNSPSAQEDAAVSS